MSEWHKQPKIQLESPFGAETRGQVALNVRYAFLAMHDSFMRGEVPNASHLSYTLALDDRLATERQLGIDAGLRMGDDTDYTAVYLDLGMSKGMQYGIEHAERVARPVVMRRLFAASLSLDEVRTMIERQSPLDPAAVAMLFARTHQM